jgi:hypothetical protein
MKLYISFFVLILIVSCSAEHYETKAKIIERRVIDKNNILIKYTFKAGDTMIIDSIRTKNKVIPHDSLRVVYSPSDPGKNTLKFE